MMSRAIPSTIFALLLLSSIQLSFSYVFNGFSILDLQNNGSAFAAEANQWSATNIVTFSKIYSQCGADYILGGYNVLQATDIGTKNQYFQRIYSNLPDHTVVRYSARIYAIDSWDANDGFQISFDNTVLDAFKLYFSTSTKYICGSNIWTDYNDLKIQGVIQHSRNTLVFRLIEGHDQGSTDESTGIREISLIFAQSPAAGMPLCVNSPSVPLNSQNIFVTKNQCQCQEGTYLDSKGVCQKCSAGCSSCFGPADTDCFVCTKPGWSWNGTQCAQCHYGCSACTWTNGYPSCVPCPGSQFYYPDSNQCYDFCDYPMTQGQSLFGNICIFPCAPGSYLYGDQSCATGCPAPNIIVKYLDTYNFCTY